MSALNNIKDSGFSLKDKNKNKSVNPTKDGKKASQRKEIINNGEKKVKSREATFKEKSKKSSVSVKIEEDEKRIAEKEINKIKRHKDRIKAKNERAERKAAGLKQKKLEQTERAKIKKEDTIKKTAEAERIKIEKKTEAEERKNKKAAEAKNKKLKKAAAVEEKKKNKAEKLEEKKRAEEARLKLEAERFAKKVSPFEKRARKLGKTRFEAEGLNFAKLIDALSKKFCIEKIEILKGKLRFSASSKDTSEIIALLDNLCYNYKILNTRGTAPLFVRILGRAGIPVGLIFFIAAAAMYPHFITKVVIDGEFNIEAQAILTESGIIDGNFIWKFDYSAVERRLDALDGIAFSSVKKQGTHVYVILKPEREITGLDDISGGTVTATKTASVTRVIVHSGTAEVKYGDIVKEGDTLIGDYLMVGDTKVPSAARGEVYGKVYHTLKLYYPDVEAVKIAGAQQTVRRLSFFGQTPKVPKSPFDLYTLETNRTSNGFLIPYEVYTYTFTEFTVVERENTRTEAMMINETAAKLFESLPAGSNYMNSITKVSRADGGYLVEVTIETEERIG